MTTRSAVDKNIGLCLGLPGKILTRSSASSAPSASVSDPYQQGTSASASGSAEQEDTAGHLPVPTKQKVDRCLYEPIDFNDTAGLDITDTAERTIDRSIIEKIFPEHSSSIICEGGVLDDIKLYPATLEACITEIETLRC